MKKSLFLSSAGPPARRDRSPHRETFLVRRRYAGRDGRLMGAAGPNVRGTTPARPPPTPIVARCAASLFMRVPRLARARRRERPAEDGDRRSRATVPARRASS